MPLDTRRVRHLLVSLLCALHITLRQTSPGRNLALSVADEALSFASAARGFQISISKSIIKDSHRSAQKITGPTTLANCALDCFGGSRSGIGRCNSSELSINCQPAGGQHRASRALLASALTQGLRARLFSAIFLFRPLLNLVWRAKNN